MVKKLAVSSAKVAQSLITPGKHNAGDNLYLVNRERHTKTGPVVYRYWCLIYARFGKRHEMVLGSANILSLAEARQKALEARRLLSDGDDPLLERAAGQRAKLGTPTFGSFADDYIETHKAKFRNPKHIAQWEMTLGDAYCKKIRSLPINEIDTDAVLSVLRPIWSRVPETASRLRGRLENVLDAAKASKFFTGDNPARWRGHLKAILPTRQRLTRGHHAALPYAELPMFMQCLREYGSTAALALEFCILTVSRSGETLGATWQEIDLNRRLWIVPASRMKAGYEHRIPLSDRALAILVDMAATKKNDHVFSGNKTSTPLSTMAMAMQLRRLGYKGITVHGFRSTFRDWASDQTNTSHETSEHALAHRISDKAEAAYRRGDQLEKRRILMQQWDEFIGKP